MIRQRAAAALAVLLTLLLGSCSWLSPEVLPRPGGDRNGYDLHLEFDSVLNLPDRAKVMLDGVPVGLVTAVGLADDRVQVTARIDAGVVIPGDVHAALRQPTVLGDIVVALLPAADPDPAAGPLPAGAVIPAARTSSPPQIEDTIASLANFVASGSIQRAHNSLVGVNRVVQTSEVGLDRISAQVSTNLAELAANLESVDLTLSGLSDTAAVLRGRRAYLDRWFSPAGMLGFDRATQVTSRLSVMIPSIGSVYSGGFWLVPMLRTVGDAAGAVQASKWAVEDEVPGWRRLFVDYFLPQDKYPAINITSIVGPDGRELSGDVHNVLRILGATP